MAKKNRPLTARLNYIDKTIVRLRGIVEGISIDDELTDTEIFKLNEWLETHTAMFEVYPFKDIAELLKRCLADGVIDGHERDEISEWCADFLNESPFAKDVTDAIRRLHGIVSGVAIDAVISEEEIIGLQDWLYDYEHFLGVWPFNELKALLDKILDDGVVTPDEKEELSEFINGFIERVIKNPNIHDPFYVEEWMWDGRPHYQPLTFFCDKEHAIEFQNKTFCFTGPAAYGSRSKLQGIAESMGGVPKNKIIRGLNYLVIGSQSSPFWVYSTYGRKIERAIEDNKTGRENIIMIYEDDFIRQVDSELV